jgi:polysaccharide biosynthesis/export protein
MTTIVTMRNLTWRVFFAAAVLSATWAPLARAQEGSFAAGEAKPAAASPGPPAPSKPAKPTKEAINAADPSLPGYTIGEQDVLDINVWREKELSGQVIVRPDGKITVPLVDEIYVLGLTPLQLQETLTEKLQPFVTAAQVTVSVREINSRKVYVMGQVAHQGVFHFNSTTTVSEIIVEAGGLREFAKHKDIYVLRNVNGKQVKLPFKYDAVIEGEENSQDLVLKPGDKIVVR